MAEREHGVKQLVVKDVTGMTIYYGSEYKVDPDSKVVTVTGGQSYDQGLKPDHGLAEPGFTEKLCQLKGVGVTHNEVDTVLVNHKQVWPVR